MRVFASFAIVATGWLLPLGTTLAADEPGSKDHPLVGRYLDSEIVYYKTSDFDEAALLRAPHDYSALLDRNATDDRSGDEWLRLEGRTTKIRYEIAKGRSSLEVTRNYESALKEKGFAVLFSCADKTCFTGNLRDSYLLGQQIDTDNGLSSRYFDRARYVLFKLERPEGAMHVSLLTGEDKQQVSAFILVVETKGMEGGKIAFIDAGKMAQSIGDQRKIDIYGIVFDFDKDDVRPESKPTLDEIAKLLNKESGLRLNIVGHTDNRGAAEYNNDLSRRRAANVVAALTRDYGIDAARLTSSGAGFSAPVASNDTEEGRAKNRRVELVAK